jgi:hypothetical protein
MSRSPIPASVLNSLINASRLFANSAKIDAMYRQGRMGELVAFWDEATPPYFPTTTESQMLALLHEARCELVRQLEALRTDTQTIGVPSKSTREPERKTEPPGCPFKYRLISSLSIEY